jgi:hypothetical protein
MCGLFAIYIDCWSCAARMQRFHKNLKLCGVLTADNSLNALTFIHITICMVHSFFAPHDGVYKVSFALIHTICKYVLIRHFLSIQNEKSIYGGACIQEPVSTS